MNKILIFLTYMIIFLWIIPISFVIGLIIIFLLIILSIFGLSIAILGIPTYIIFYLISKLETIKNKKNEQ